MINFIKIIISQSSKLPGINTNIQKENIPVMKFNSNAINIMPIITDMIYNSKYISQEAYKIFIPFLNEDFFILIDYSGYINKEN